MTKTKRKLRAEAVERLRSKWNAGIQDTRQLFSALAGKDGSPTYAERSGFDALIDLLEDDEPPEGDAVAILREADDGSVRLKAFAYDPRSLTKLADMVERDYVRREDNEEPRVSNLTWLYANDMLFNAFTRWFVTYAGRADDDIQADEWLMAEHGEWRAKAERGMTNLEYLYWDTIADGDAFHNGVVDLARPYYIAAHPDEERVITWRIGEWLMAEHGAEVVLNAEKYDLEPESGAESHTGDADVKGRTAAQAPEQGFVTEQQLEPDTREKLEEDVDTALYIAEMHDQHVTFGMIVGWLDRQAAITERECQQRFDAYFARKMALHGCGGADSLIDELQAKVKSLEAENADDAKAINNLANQLKNMTGARDHWQRVAGKNGDEVGKLRKALVHDKRMRAGGLPDGIAWPRFEDGTLVRYGDITDVGRVQSVQFFNPSKWGSVQLSITGVDHEKRMFLENGEKVKRPPMLAHDGQPIEVGQTLYGLSDGKSWIVAGISHDKKHPVLAECRDALPMEVEERALKPEWLSHERPDTPRSLLFRFLTACGEDDPEHYAEQLDEYAERIEKLGGKA